MTSCTCSARAAAGLQIGGSDQWANILAGVDLIRRAEDAEAYGLVAPLLTTNSGEKMGKTAAGALWLDAERTAPFDFYQYWINVEDARVPDVLGVLTLLPMARVRELAALRGPAVREAKEALAYEITATVHGADAALEARETSRALFAGQRRSQRCHIRDHAGGSRARGRHHGRGRAGKQRVGGLARRGPASGRAGRRLRQRRARRLAGCCDRNE